MDISIYIVEFLHILLQTTKLSTKANITTTTTTTTAVLIVYFQCMCVCCLREPINAFKNQITNQLKNDRLKWNRKQLTLTNNTRQHPNPNWKKKQKKKEIKTAFQLRPKSVWQHLRLSKGSSIQTIIPPYAIWARFHYHFHVLKFQFQNQLSLAPTLNQYQLWGLLEPLLSIPPEFCPV